MAGLSTVSDDWQSITTDDIINGHKYNTDFVLLGYEPVYFIGDKSIKVSYSNDTIQNCTQILANLLRSNDELTIKTFEATGENKYTVGKCSNIQYVARYIDSKIESITSTSVCDIPLDVSEKIGKYDARFTSNALGGQLVCRITSNDVEYLRAFTISGQEITLLDIVTGSVSAIASLAVDDRFELINAYDILEEGLEETTGYPVQGFVKKHVKPNEDTSFVEFGKYDTPAKLSGEKVVIAYNALDDYNQTFIYDGSIDKYGIFTKKEDLNFALTQSQLTYIETTLKKFTEPNITIELETFRPSKPLKGWNVNVNIPELDLTGIFKITRVSEVFISETGQLIDKPFRLWKVTLSNYENNLAQLLAGLKKKNDSKAKLAINQVLRTAMSLDLQFKWIDDPSVFGLDAPTAYDATNITNDDFEANWSYVANANDYIVFVALDIDFNTPVSGFAGLLVGNVTTRLIDGQDVTDNETFYYKVKAINTELGLESDWSNVITANKSTWIGGFPETITGAWGTLTLDYGLRIEHLSDNDNLDYSGNNNNYSIIRRSASDVYPVYTQDGADWCIDFTNASYSALEIADSATYELNTNFTIIMVLKNKFDDTDINANNAYLMRKWDQGVTLVQDSYIVSQYQKAIFLSARSTGGSGLLQYGSPNVTSQSKYAFSFSYACSTDTKVNVKNQVSQSITINSNSAMTAINNSSSSLRFGHDYGSSWLGNQFQGKLFKLAIIKQSLTDAQIKAIHSHLGY